MRRAPVDPDELPGAAEVGEAIALPDRVSHYLVDVLRLRAGSRVELFDGTGRLVVVELVEANSGMRGEVISDRRTDRGESPCAITLCQAIPKGKRWEWLLEKTTELGVGRIVPLETSRTVVSIADSKVDRKLDRWERIIDEAARQSQRAVTPVLDEPRDVASALDAVDASAHLVPHTAGQRRSAADALVDVADDRSGDRSVAIWIGPEGGFTDAEVDQILAAGALAVHLGPRVLRSETAGIAAVCLVQSLLGDLA